MPKKKKPLKISYLTDKENEEMCIVSGEAGYNDDDREIFIRRVEKCKGSFHDLVKFTHWRIKANKFDDLFDLCDNKNIDNMKEVNSYVKLSKQLKPSKVNLRINQKTQAVKHFEDGLKEIKKRKWNPKTKSIDIPLEGGGTKTLHFDSKKDFDDWNKSDINNVDTKITYEENKLKHWGNIKSFREVLE